MIRPLGPGSLFCSFFSGETQWTHLFKILGILVDEKEYVDDQLENLNWEEKCRSIQSDPVTCARHSDFQISHFVNHFLISEVAPLGKVGDWFYRVEYQQWGLPRIHMLIWLENATVFGIDDDVRVTVVTAFINKGISCKQPADNPELLKLVKRQSTGIHTLAEKKKKKNQKRSVDSIIHSHP